MMFIRSLFAVWCIALAVAVFLAISADAQTGSGVEGAPSWIVTLLQQYGLAGLVIFVLAGVVWILYQALAKSNDSRLNEREIMIRALSDDTAAIRENAKATMDRNEVTKLLADSIARQSGTFELFMQKVDMQNESVREKLNTQAEVFSQMSEAMRNTTAAVREMRDNLSRLIK